MLEPLEARLVMTAVPADPLLSGADDLLSDEGPWAAPQSEVGAPNDVFATPQAGTASPGGYTPDQMRTAYGYNQIFFEGGSIVGDGTGQTIAIVNAHHTPTALSDLTAFSNHFGIPMPPSFTQVDQNGGTNYTTTSGGWALETALDIQWAHALAPGADILLVEADSASFNDLGIALDYARSQTNVSIVSMSWGGPEFPTQTSFDAHFATPANHSNVSFFAAAGNSGAPGLYPAYSPDVMAVGGTTLSLDAQGNILGESSWGSSGGGISQYESQPVWQNGFVTQSATQRTMPDVAFLANPSTGVPVYDTFNNSPSTPWTKVAGTSFATPSWGALVAIANQGRELAGLPELDIPELMTAIYDMPASNFNDITISGGGPANPAEPGYDLVTGRGTPKGELIVEYLVGLGSISGTVFDDANGNGVQDGEPGLSGWTVYADLDTDGTFDASASNTFNSTDVPKSISTISTATSTNLVSGLTGRVMDVNVTVNIDHNRLSDLVLTLVSPSGTHVKLADGVGGAADDFINTKFDDSAPISINVGTAPFSGSFHPEEMLLDFFAENPNGTWTLEVQDTLFGTNGTLNSWSLELTTGDPSAVSSFDGSYYIDALPAGTYDVRQVLQAPFSQTAPVGGFYTVGLAFAAHVVDRDFGNQAPASATPTGVALQPTSDTGASNSDQITRLNNSSPGEALQFEVTGTIAGATVTLFADGTPIGSTTASGTTTIVTTDGATTLADGLRTITARQTAPGNSQSSDSPAQVIQIDTQAPVATLVAVTPDPRTTPVPQMTIQFSESVTGLELGDLSLTVNAGANLLTGAQAPTSGDGITWTIGNLTSLTTAPGFYELVMSPTGAPIVDVAGNVNSDVESTSFTVNSLVLGRRLFYNASAFDGNDPAANSSDDAAIAPDKSAYLPGSGAATFANVSSYSRGINGIMIDINTVPGTLSASDFVFKVGNNNSPSTWVAAAAPSAIVVRSGAGVSGSDRVEITWANNAIEKQWLEVQVLPTANTGLGTSDVFFFGNALGDSGTGNSATAAPVNATDEIGARNNPHTFANPAAIDDVFDYDRDTFVNATDQVISRNNSTNFATQLTLIDLGAGGPFAPGGDASDDGDEPSGGEGGTAAPLVVTADEPIKPLRSNSESSDRTEPALVPELPPAYARVKPPSITKWAVQRPADARAAESLRPATRHPAIGASAGRPIGALSVAALHEAAYFIDAFVVENSDDSPHSVDDDLLDALIAGLDRDWRRS